VTDQSDDAAPETEEEPTPPPPKARKVGLLAAIALSVVVLDVISKVVVVATVQPNEPVRLLGGLVYLSLIRNPGAAFSMATGMTWLLALIAIGVVVFIVRMAPRLRSTPWAVSLGLVLGGAIGNLIDRIFRAPGFLQGHVVDFVSVFGPNAEYFPVFNVADSAITIGGISLVITALLGIDFDGTRTKSRKAESA
jgi:signal peptidase II